MSIKPKKHGLGLEIKTLEGKSGNSYLVYKTGGGSFHVFQEVEAKAAAEDCGAKKRDGNTRQRWESIWNR